MVKKLQRAKQDKFEMTKEAEGRIHQKVSILQRVLMSPISFKLGFLDLMGGVDSISDVWEINLFLK